MTAKEQAGEAGNALLDMDHSVHEAVKPDRYSSVVKVLGKLSDIGDQPQARTLCGSLIVIGLVRSDTRMMAAGMRMLLAHELATAAKSVIKHRVDRKRPRSADGKHEERPTAGDSRDKEESSFPSGHSAGAMALACAYGAVYPQHRAGALLAGSSVALAQIPRCAHYPTDVGAGIAIGVAADGIFSLGWRLARLAMIFVMRRSI
jgi:membrane-associated phospholipid phosphatase